MHELEPAVQLRTRLGVGERELGGADQGEQGFAISWRAPRVRRPSVASARSSPSDKSALVTAL